MPTDVTSHLETGRRMLDRMAANPCALIEIALEAEQHALEASGAEPAELRAAVESIDRSEEWSEVQRRAFVAYVTYVDERADLD